MKGSGCLDTQTQPETTRNDLNRRANKRQRKPLNIRRLAYFVGSVQNCPFCFRRPMLYPIELVVLSYYLVRV